MRKIELLKKPLLACLSLVLMAGIFVIAPVRQTSAQTASDLSGCTFQYFTEDNGATINIEVTSACNQLGTQGMVFHYMPDIDRFASGLDVISLPDHNEPGSGLYSTLAGGGDGAGVPITISGTQIARTFFGQNQPNPDPEVPDIIEREEENPDSTDPEEDNSCESTSGPLGWIMCPVAGVLDGVTGFLDSEIQSLLTIDEESVLRGESGDGLKAIWSQIRNIAYVILVPIMLVMVIGTALGFEVFSAYTIKKALPRMILAVIFITLSWYICMFLIEFANVLGAGIKGLVTSPFNNVDWVSEGGSGPPSGLKAALQVAGISGSGDQGVWQGLAEVGTTATALGIAAIGAGLAGGLVPMTILSTLTTAALVLGTVFLILIARQMFIIAALLVAPLAILAWIFPGNDKLWKLWWTMFSKLLMMFPLIMLILGVGEVFALVTANARAAADGNRLITSIMIIAAVIIPYALIPFTFKWAGGVFGNLAGMVNDKERGIFDRLKKGRSESRAKAREQNMARPKAAIAGMRYKGARALMGRNSKTGRFLANKVGGYEWESANSARNAEEAKRIQAEKDSGNDAQIRGATANLARIDSLRKKAKKGDINTSEKAWLDDNYDAQKGQVKTLGGSWVSESDARLGQKRFKGNRGAQQAALTYEFGKARNSEDTARLLQEYDSLASGQWGMSDMEADGAWVGAAFGTQGQHIELKKAKAIRDEDGSVIGRAIDHKGFVQELHDTKGSYPLGQMDSHTMDTLNAAYDSGDAATQQQIEQIVDTFKMRGMGGVQSVGDDGSPIPPQADSRTDTVSSPGSAASQNSLEILNEKIQNAKNNNGS